MSPVDPKNSTPSPDPFWSLQFTDSDSTSDQSGEIATKEVKKLSGSQQSNDEDTGVSDIPRLFQQAIATDDDDEDNDIDRVSDKADGSETPGGMDAQEVDPGEINSAIDVMSRTVAKSIGGKPLLKSIPKEEMEERTRKLFMDIIFLMLTDPPEDAEENFDDYVIRRILDNFADLYAPGSQEEVVSHEKLQRRKEFFQTVVAAMPTDPESPDMSVGSPCFDFTVKIQMNILANKYPADHLDKLIDLGLAIPQDVRIKVFGKSVLRKGCFEISINFTLKDFTAIQKKFDDSSMKLSDCESDNPQLVQDYWNEVEKMCEEAGEHKDKWYAMQKHWFTIEQDYRKRMEEEKD